MTPRRLSHMIVAAIGGATLLATFVGACGQDSDLGDGGECCPPVRFPQQTVSSGETISLDVATLNVYGEFTVTIRSVGDISSSSFDVDGALVPMEAPSQTFGGSGQYEENGGGSPTLVRVYDWETLGIDAKKTIAIHYVNSVVPGPTPVDVEILRAACPDYPLHC